MVVSHAMPQPYMIPWRDQFNIAYVESYVGVSNIVKMNDEKSQIKSDCC